MSKKRKKRRFYTIVFLLLLAAAFFYVKSRFFPVVKLKDRNYVFLYVERRDLLEDVAEKLLDAGAIRNEDGFEWVAERMGLRENLHPGKYRITNGMTVRQIINLIRYRKEEKVKLNFNSQIRDLEEFIDYADDKLALERAELELFFRDSARLRESFGLNEENALAAVVPGTMPVSWAISMPEFVAALKERYDNLYTGSRRRQAANIGFTMEEVQVIASIVQSESNIAAEQRKIAGVYINRLKKKMPLQADPTLKYACRNFELQRILDKDKEVDSPYNTYRRKGLPPGPICLVSRQALDATLNYEKHRFMYFCARPELNGYSNFSVTYDEHRRHARRSRARW